MAQVQIISGVERRRRWSEEQKRQIVRAAFAPDTTVSEVARQADLHNSVIYKWRRELQSATAPAGFAEVTVLNDGPRPAGANSDAIDITLGTGAHVRIPCTISADLATAVVKALVRR